MLRFSVDHREVMDMEIHLKLGCVEINDYCRGTYLCTKN